MNKKLIALALLSLAAPGISCAELSLSSTYEIVEATDIESTESGTLRISIVNNGTETVSDATVHFTDAGWISLSGGIETVGLSDLQPSSEKLIELPLHPYLNAESQPFSAYRIDVIAVGDSAVPQGIQLFSSRSLP